MNFKYVIAALALGLMSGTASADTYTSVNFSGGIFGGNANVSAPFTGVVSPGDTYSRLIRLRQQSGARRGQRICECLSVEFS